MEEYGELAGMLQFRQHILNLVLYKLHSVFFFIIALIVLPKYHKCSICFACVRDNQKS